MEIIRENTLSTFDLIKLKKSTSLDLKINENNSKTVNYDFSHISKKEYEEIYIEPSRYNYVQEEDKVVFLWNTASESIVILNRKEFDEYKRFTKGKICTDFILSLYMLGFFVEKGMDEVFRVDLLRKRKIYTYPEDGNIDIEILPTQKCNARCFYCFEKGLQPITMSKSIIDDTVDFISKRAEKCKNLKYIWFGGEPLLGESVIDRIILGVNHKIGNRISYSSSITTNGSMISQKLINKFIGIWRVNDILISLDGYKDEHGRRKGIVGLQADDLYMHTLQRIEMLLQHEIDTTCRINLDKENYYHLDDILKDLELFKDHSRFHIQVTTLRNRLIKKPDAEKYFFPHEYEEFYENVINALFKHGFYDDSNMFSLVPRRNYSNCIACSLNKIIINSSGDLYKCIQYPMDEDNCVGNVRTGIIQSYNYSKWYRELDYLGDECETCILLPCCHGGCKVYRKYPTKDTTPCIRQKYYIKHAVKYILGYYEERTL